MLNTLLRWFVRAALWLRYRIRIHGLERVAEGGTTGVLFLPNHPALIDPVILAAVLQKRFRARFLADENQIDRFFIRWLARRIDVVPIPDPIQDGAAARHQVEEGLGRCIEALRGGDNLVIYPSGHLAHGREEDLYGNSAVRQVLDAVPDARVVLVRTRGLWGSGFSYAYGKVPAAGETLKQGIPSLLASGVFFAPRREVDIEFVEHEDFPRDAEREELNRWLEHFYNADAPAATYVPRSVWEGGGVRELPEPQLDTGEKDLSAVPESTRELVLGQLRERTDVEEIRDDMHLARDLGLDSLARADLLTWVTEEFGFEPGDVEGLQTVGDLMLAACGESAAGRMTIVSSPPRRWFAAGGAAPWLAETPTIAAAFLARARRRPGQAVLADQRSGVRTYRDIVTRLMLLMPRVAEMPGDAVGILLPAGVAADVTYLAVLLAGKTPVMINWTVGPRNLAHCLDHVGLRAVLTSEELVGRLEASGTDLSPARDRFVYLERLAKGIGPAAKLAAFARSWLSWRSLDAAAERLDADDRAVVLFTSGSETLPKAVPLTHANILANVRDIVGLDIVRGSDRLLGILPPFHSFGLTVTTVLPLCVGVPVAHHPDPTEARVLAQLVEAYRTTLMVGTPTFLGSIARAAVGQQLAPLRLAVVGAEKCPDRVYDRLAEANGEMEILEGYGVTECSPIVSVNRPGRSRRGTIGEPLPSFDHAIVDEESCRRAEAGRQGMLLVRGPSVFGGYIDYEGASPFIRFEGKQWYRTGDLVSEQENGVLTFRGRRKRFVKLGGEMISLPAIESALLASRPDEEIEQSEGPLLAVEADDADQPQIVLFTTVDLDRRAANNALREAGLSPLHNIRRVERLEEIPVLGTGKTDYRALKRRLREER